MNWLVFVDGESNKYITVNNFGPNGISKLGN